MTFQIRQFSWDDTAELVSTLNRALEHDGEFPHFTETNFRHRYDMAAHNLSHSFVAIDKGKIVGGVISLFGSGKAYCTGAVHPEYRQRGIGYRLIEASDAAILETGEKILPPQSPIYVLRECKAENGVAQSLYTSLNYLPTRYFYQMGIDLPQEINPTALPEKVEIYPFIPERDANTLYEAHNSAFRDHWGQRHGVSFETWKMNVMRADTNFDLWITAWENERIVGFSLGEIMDATAAHGKVRLVGVIPEWRRQGLGLAMLERSFERFIEHGLRFAELNVDSAGDTNPLSLYLRAGMEIKSETIMFRRILRGHAEDIQD